MLELKNISGGYGKKQVLFDITFKVDRGEIALMIGGNGAGKSTVLKRIFGLIQHWNTGQVLFDGEDITRLHTSKMISKGLVYIPQKDNCFEDLTVQENLEVAGLNLSGKKLLKERINYVRETFPILYKLRKRTPFKMSGGEKRILTLGMALIHQPKMIMLDEPTAGLSPKNVELVLEKILELKENNDITFIIVEHRVRELLRLTDKIIGLKYGGIFQSINYNKSITESELLNDIFV